MQGVEGALVRLRTVRLGSSATAVAASARVAGGARLEGVSSMSEFFRVFRVDDADFLYVGTFEGANVKEAVQKALYADTDGANTYEAHVVRNASVWEAKSRNERFVDTLRQVPNSNIPD